jgi:aminoglycoside phosphotransferase family enzyme
MAAKKQTEGINAKEMAMVGAGIAAIAAGAYFFFGPQGKKHQKQMKGWMVRMKGEVLEKIEGAKEMSEEAYNEIVNTVARTHELAGKIPKEEIMALATDLKKQWRSIKKNAASTKKVVKKASATAKKTTRKITK